MVPAVINKAIALIINLLYEILEDRIAFQRRSGWVFWALQLVHCQVHHFPSRFQCAPYWILLLGGVWACLQFSVRFHLSTGQVIMFTVNLCILLHSADDHFAYLHGSESNVHLGSKSNRVSRIPAEEALALNHTTNILLLVNNTRLHPF